MEERSRTGKDQNTLMLPWMAAHNTPRICLSQCLCTIATRHFSCNEILQIHEYGPWNKLPPGNCKANSTSEKSGQSKEEQVFICLTGRSHTSSPLPSPLKQGHSRLTQDPGLRTSTLHSIFQIYTHSRHNKTWKVFNISIFWIILLPCLKLIKTSYTSIGDAGWSLHLLW